MVGESNIVSIYPLFERSHTNCRTGPQDGIVEFSLPCQNCSVQEREAVETQVRSPSGLVTRFLAVLMEFKVIRS